MTNNDNKDIKFTGDPVAFDGVEGRRDPKTNKGRFDLIPEEVYGPVFQQIDTWKCSPDRTVTFDKMDIFNNIANEKWVVAILQMCVYGYIDQVNRNGAYTFKGTCFPEAIEPCFWKMMPDLAIHFQKGAEHYGERNCQKGIPLWSFKDSALRHAAQTFAGLTDEPHIISVIWNCWMAQWTVMQSDKKLKADSKAIKEIIDKYGPDSDFSDLMLNPVHEAYDEALKAMCDADIHQIAEDFKAGDETSTGTDYLIKYISELLMKKRKELKDRMFAYHSADPMYRALNEEQKKLKYIINRIGVACSEINICSFGAEAETNEDTKTEG